MIRKAIIVVLTLCTLVVLLVGWGSRDDISMLDPRQFISSFDFAFWHLNIGWAAPASQGISLEWAPDGFAYYVGVLDGVTVVQIPLWIIVALFATYPFIVFIRGPLRRWRRKKKGLCLKCGYDLTGNVSGVCPDCGTEIKQP